MPSLIIDGKINQTLSLTSSFSYNAVKYSKISLNTCNPSVMPCWFNVSCQFTPLLNLCSLIFGLTPFDWLCSIITVPLFLTRISILIHAFLIYVHFFKKTTRAQNKAFVKQKRNLADITRLGRVKSWLHLLRIQILYSYWILITGWLSANACVRVFQHILQSQKVII